MYSENDTKNFEDNNLTDFDKYYMDSDKSFNLKIKFRRIKTLSSSGYESWWKKEKKNEQEEKM